MIFQHTWQQVLGLNLPLKTQTRRLVKLGDHLEPNDFYPYSSYPFPLTVIRNDRIIWRVGRTYAVQPGRGRKAVGRIRITDICKERLQAITPEDIWDEGIRLADLGDFDPLDRGAPDVYDTFRILWNSIHTKSGTRWLDNPECWVLLFILEKVE